MTIKNIFWDVDGVLANLNFYGVTLNAKREKLSFRIFFYRMER